MRYNVSLVKSILLSFLFLPGLNLGVQESIRTLKQTAHAQTDIQTNCTHRLKLHTRTDRNQSKCTTTWTCKQTAHTNKQTNCTHEQANTNCTQEQTDRQTAHEMKKQINKLYTQRGHTQKQTGHTKRPHTKTNCTHRSRPTYKLHTLTNCPPPPPPPHTHTRTSQQTAHT